MPADPNIGNREREILTAIVETFISTGEPVGSRTLARSNREGLSPASIRNVMADLSDAFVALPGGVGTLDELIEMVSWFDLGVHQKPTYLCNIDGFWDPLLGQIERFRERGMLRANAGGSLHPATDVASLVTALARFLEGGARA